MSMRSFNIEAGFVGLAVGTLLLVFLLFGALLWVNMTDSPSSKPKRRDSRGAQAGTPSGQQSGVDTDATATEESQGEESEGTPSTTQSPSAAKKIHASPLANPVQSETTRLRKRLQGAEGEGEDSEGEWTMVDSDRVKPEEADAEKEKAE